MTRALLRAGQIRDPDVLTEHEHAVLVHQNLTTSGTLNFQDGTISGTGDIYATTYYGDGSELTGVGAGNPESLYYSGSPIATAIANGISLNSNMLISHDGTNSFIRNKTSGGDIYLQAKDSSGTRRTLFHGDPDGPSKIYHDSYPRLETSTVGDGGILIRNDSNQIFDMYWSGNTFYIDSAVDSASIVIRGENSNSDNTTMATFDPNGASKLCYAGTEVFETQQYGISITDGTSPGTKLYYSSDDFYIDNTDSEGMIWIRTTTAGSVTQPSIICVPDGYIRLYYKSNRSLETTLDGIDVYDSHGYKTSLKYGGTDFQIRNTAGYAVYLVGSDGAITYGYRNGNTGVLRLYNTNGYGSIETLTNDFYINACSYV